MENMVLLLHILAMGFQPLVFGGVGGHFIQPHKIPPNLNMEPENDCVYNRNLLFQGRKTSDEPCEDSGL